ncbi:MAG: PEP-CTERM sorting domain-containing protein [Phycisphaerales bacterium]|nr:PEP-CTERM sorting domain-containing protein [Phycisphaerales bacterium]
MPALPRRTRVILARSTVVVPLSLTGFAALASAVPAFPGATGFGANANGGRGGDVYRVTSLADTLTPGTLRYGLRESGFPAAGRTIVFDVGGVINLTSNLDVKNIRNVTIAGETAPGGITLAGRTLQITGSNNKITSDIIIRHIAVRGPSSEDAISIKGAGHTYNVILDHVSTSWSKDELLSSTQSINNITVQNSFITEALNPTGHSYGSLVRPLSSSTLSTSNVTYSYNLYSNNKSRNPRPGTYDGKLLNFEFFNNVVYNWSDRAGYSGGSSEGQTEYVRMNYVGNYLIAGPATPAGAKSTTAFTRDASNSPIDIKVYQAGNLIDSNKNAVRDGTNTGWGMFSNWNGSVSSPFPVADQMSSPFPFAQTTFDTAEDAYAIVLASGGAQPWNRSAVDRRYVQEVMTNTGAVINTLPSEWNDIINTPPTFRPAGWDTDSDGMPNWWETARGLNPNVANHNGLMSNGYTNLENYLNYLHLQANWNVDGNGLWSGYLNWAGIRPNAIDATAGFGPVITQPVTVTVPGAVTVGQMRFDSVHGYTINGPGTVTIDVISGYAMVDVLAGNHVIAAPLTLQDDLRLTVSAVGASLLLAVDLSAAGKNITKAGPGALGAQQVRSAALNVESGTVTISPKAGSADPTGTSRVSALTVATGAVLDLTNNALVIDAANPAAAYSDLKAAINAGRIVSSLADASHALGYASNSALGLATFAGQTVNPNSVLARHTRLGDANLDGTTDIGDFSLLAAGFNGVGDWQQGDFNRDSSIDLGDFSLLAANFNQSAVGGLPRASIPEPSVAAGMSIALWAMGSRRRFRGEPSNPKEMSLCGRNER